MGRVGSGRIGSWVKTDSGQNGSIKKKGCFGSGRTGFGSERVRVRTGPGQNGSGSERVSGRVGSVKNAKKAFDNQNQQEFYT
ncbi:hypothetical protein Hanom_Chr11g01016091 [Helianthus anomalus]